jgi:hypothetical protein
MLFPPLFPRPSARCRPHYHYVFSIWVIALAIPIMTLPARAQESVHGTAAKSELTIAPEKLDFGNVAVGTTQTLTLGLSTNGGNITITSISSGSAQFAALDVKLPLTISARKETPVNVTFKPQKDGESLSTLSFISNAANSPTRESLGGDGTAPYVVLSWNPSASDVVGYNIYRSTAENGTYSKMNSKLDPETDYTDASIAAGKTYYYKTTAVNSSGKESRYSEGVEIVVP